jgi:outer membrane lipoprotein-sorting protein
MRAAFFALLLTGLTLLVRAPLDAQPAAPSVTASPRQQADVAAIETYLNGLTTAQADFTFAAPDGQIAHGAFFLSRPDKLRFQYTEPAGNLMIADGDYVIYWDAAQKEASNLPIDSTPLSFLLRAHISLTDGVTISGYEHSAGILRVRLVEANDPSQGSVTVAFGDQPMELKGWRLTDPQGQVTDVTFANWKYGMRLDPALFHYEEPNEGKRHR